MIKKITKRESETKSELNNQPTTFGKTAMDTGQQIKGFLPIVPAVIVR